MSEREGERERKREKEGKRERKREKEREKERERENSWWVRERGGENCKHRVEEGWGKTLLSLFKSLH